MSLFTHCGGCHYQHIAYDYQLKLKKKLIKEFISHNLKININEIGEIPYKDQDGFNYRKRAVFHIDEDKNIGFFKGETREVVDIESCNILSFSVLESFKKVKEVLKNFKNLFYLLVIDDDNEAEGNEPTIVLHLKEEKEFLNIAKENNFLILRELPFKRLIVKYKEKEIYKNFIEELASGHFSQVNKNANNALIDFVVKNVTQNNILELYAGSGNFSFPLAKLSKNILAVELDSKLVDLGKERAKKLNLENKVRFVQSSCEKFVKKNKFSECIILDPPRSGAKEVVKYFNTKDTKEIIYISCNLASLQRDLKILEDKGFTIKDIRMLDMFPQTYHVETVCLMSRIKGK